ncbi:replication protein C, IncQ-type [Xanthomonas albilineans]|uniref:replication protein C, IncQ-type n=1 Tax=Xanthomonas albilineans TaxID=29447 RepID=UPI000AA1F8DE
MAFDLTHARHDPMHCLVPGLFRSLKRGERKKLKLDVTYHYAENEQARFVGFEPLGADDMRLLQGLVALGGPKGIILTPEPTADLPRQLRLFLEPKFDAVGQDALVVRESMTSLLCEIGLTDGGDNIRAIKASLLRMANVTVVVTKGSRQRSFHLMSYAFDEEDGRLFVALNPQIAEAILGRRPYTRIEMAEVRALQTDPARLIHQRLCGWIDPGKAGRAELDTLCGYVWPDEANAEAMKKRRQKARKALAELDTVGWKVNEYAEGKWEIGRPKPVATLPVTRSNVPHPELENTVTARACGQFANSIHDLPRSSSRRGICRRPVGRRQALADGRPSAEFYARMVVSSGRFFLAAKTLRPSSVIGWCCTLYVVARYNIQQFNSIPGHAMRPAILLRARPAAASSFLARLATSRPRSTIASSDDGGCRRWILHRRF